MTHVLVIDADPAGRQAVRQCAPVGSTVTEAATGLAALDQVRRGDARPDLVVLDPALPDLDGCLVAVQIRAALPDVPIVPFTHTLDPLSFLADLGCAPYIFKPTTGAQVRQVLAAALGTRPTPPPQPAVLHWLSRHAQQVERRVRDERAARRVLVYASAPLLRHGLRQVLTPIALVHDVAQTSALREALGQSHYHAMVVSIQDVTLGLAAARAYHLPVIVIVTTVAEALAMQETAQVAAVLATDPVLAIRLHHILEALVTGEPVTDTPGQCASFILPDIPIVPRYVADCFAASPISRQQLTLLWLDAQGCSRQQIAQLLRVSTSTIDCYWKRIQQALARDRTQVRIWVYDQLHQHAQLDGCLGPTYGEERR